MLRDAVAMLAIRLADGVVAQENSHAKDCGCTEGLCQRCENLVTAGDIRQLLRRELSPVVSLPLKKEVQP